MYDSFRYNYAATLFAIILFSYFSAIPLYRYNRYLDRCTLSSKEEIC